MVTRGEDVYILYPLYFDRCIPRSRGRRVAKKYAVEKPTAEDTAKAARALGLSPLIEKEASHPSRPWRKEGRVLVKKKKAKTTIINQIASLL